MSSESETKVHFRVARFIHESGLKLRMQPLTVATASVIYMRFFKIMTLSDFDPYLIATTSVYLAGKIEEDYRKIRDVINVSYRTLYKNRPMLELDSMYWSLKESVSNCELFILRVLQFKVSFTHPHKFMLHYLKSLRDWFTPEEWKSVPLATTAWSLLRDSYHSSVPLEHKPQHVAIALVYLALQCLGLAIPCSDVAETPWWKVFDDDVTLAELEIIMTKTMDIYELEAKP